MDRVIGDRFEILAPAGRGGMADVYRAVDRATGETVAVKLLRTTLEGVERFLREAHVLAMLTHPAIVRYVAHGDLGPDGCFLAMEWLEGETLADRLRRGPLGIEAAIGLASGVAGALSAAHAMGVVHRDVKPGNVFLVGGEASRAKLLDFGIAHLPTSSVELTVTGVILGTPAYMAPEQATGLLDIDARVDVFSLGCVLFGCLTGRPPFQGKSAAAILAKIVLDEPPRVRDLASDVPDALDALVARMMAKDRARRPPAGDAVVRALAELGAVDAARPEPAPAPAPEKQLVTVVLGRRTAASTAPELDAAQRDALDRLASRHGADRVLLADGSILLALRGPDAVEQAVRAGRAGLALHEARPALRVAIATGQAELPRRPVGEVIDLASELCDAEPPPAGVRIGEVAAGLLPPRFDLQKDGASWFVAAEGRAATPVRTLLGAETPCVGRDAELRRLALLAEHAFSAPEAGAVLLVGPAGSGKSRLRHELLRIVSGSTAGLRIAVGHGDPMTLGAPYALAAEVVRELCAIPIGEPGPATRERIRTRLARHLAPADGDRASAFLAEVAGHPLDDAESTLLRSARRDPRLMADQAARAFTELVAAAAGGGPLLLVLEDVQWGDPPSLDLVAEGLRRLPQAPLFVIATARPDGCPPALREVVHAELSVRPLAAAAARALARSVLGDGADGGSIEELIAQAGGNAFFLEELIRAEAEGRRATLPGTVLAVLQARMSALDPPARRALRAASVYGAPVRADALRSLLSPGIDAAVLLDRLAREELLVGRSGGREEKEASYDFRHALVQEAAYGMLTEEERAAFHRGAARFLSGRPDAEPFVLATHLEQGGEPQAAIPWYRRAADDALRANDFAGAIARAERAVGCGATAQTLGELLAIEADAHRYRGENRPSIERAREAMSLLPRASPPWCHAAALLARRSGAVELAELAREIEDVSPGDADSIRLICAVARALYVIGDPGRADAVLDRIPADVSLDPMTRADLHGVRSWRALANGQIEQELREVQAAVRCHETAGDARGACRERGNTGYTLMSLGQLEDAERELRTALVEAESCRLPYFAGAARHNLGLVLALRGDMDAAVREEKLAVSILAAPGGEPLEAAARAYLARILLLRGELEVAEEEARASLRLAEGSPREPQSLAIVAQVELARGRPDDARAASARAIALMKTDDRAFTEGTGFVYLCHAEVLEACGDRDAARAALAVARDRLLDVLARIEDPALRTSFLSRVPEHARTLELAERWGV